MSSFHLLPPASMLGSKRRLPIRWSMAARRLARRCLPALLLPLILLATGPARAADATPAAPPAWGAFLQGFIEHYFLLHPDVAVQQGRHEFDGELPDWSAEGLERMSRWLTAEKAAAQTYADAGLNAGQRFEKAYLLARIDNELFWMQEARQPWQNPSYYTNSLDPSVYLTRPYATLPARLQAFIHYLHSVPRAAAQIRSNLHLPLPRTFLTLGVNSFGGYASFYRKEVPQIFTEVHDPLLQASLAEAIEPAADAMQSLADTLKAGEGTATEDFALGARRFADMLYQTERVDTPLAELSAVGRRDLKRNLEALHDACALYAPGASVQTCVDRVNANKASGGAVDGARAQLGELRSFIVAHNVVSIPGSEQALVAEAPAYQRWNFAYIDIAGPYDSGMPSVYNIAPPDPAWPMAEQLAYTPGRNVLLFTSVHEVWPGHFLQFLHANRSPRLFGRLFVGYAFAEGWAHYSEEMMWDAGLGQGSPEVHIGQLLEALLRNVRFVCAIGLHTEHMSVGECERLFREQAYADAGNARQQAARGTFDPAYLNYTMGKLMIGKLRDDWVASRGGRQSWKAFHDAFLSYGGPPIPLVRAEMLGNTTGAADLFAR